MNNQPSGQAGSSGRHLEGGPELAVVCPGCGISLVSQDSSTAERFNASSACLQIYWQLSAFTLSLRDPDFPHQIAVDAYAAQHSGPKVKAITTAFALIGLSLVFEKGYTGRAAQLAHMQLGRQRMDWPRFEPPAAKAAITVKDVLEQINESNYDEQLRRWGRSVWAIWHSEHPRIGDLVHARLKD
jgi:hypothetical protein